MPDEEYLKRMFKAKMGRELDLENPQTFNEKLQWMKIHDRKSIYTTMVDKYAAKDFLPALPFGLSLWGWKVPSLEPAGTQIHQNPEYDFPYRNNLQG